MYRFPVNFYSDVRIEDVTQTTIGYQDLELRQRKVRTTRGPSCGCLTASGGSIPP